MVGLYRDPKCENVFQDAPVMNTNFTGLMATSDSVDTIINSPTVNDKEKIAFLMKELANCKEKVSEISINVVTSILTRLMNMKKFHKSNYVRFVHHIYIIIVATGIHNTLLHIK